jgi:hypothetical protein
METCQAEMSDIHIVGLAWLCFANLEGAKEHRNDQIFNDKPFLGVRHSR